MSRQPNLKFNYSKAKNAQPEAALQKAVVQIIRLAGMPGLVWGASLNGVKLGIKTATHMKKQGMNAGFPDLCFLIAGHFYGMEVKAGKAGRQTPEQKEFERKVLAQGGTYMIVRDIDEAIKYLEAWSIIRPRTKTRMTYSRAA
jgi:hypothetical protein